MKAWIGWALALIVIIAVYMLFANHITPSTNDAYLHGYSVEVAPQVSGKIVTVFVKNDEFVSKDQVLFQVDPRNYQFNVTAAEQKLITTQDVVSQLIANVEKNKDAIIAKKSDLALAQINYQEQERLSKAGYVSKIKLLDAQNDLSNAQQALQDAEHELVISEKALGSNVDGVNIHIKQAETNLGLQRLYLQETTVRAPAPGFITNLNTQVGNYATAGAPQMALVLADLWFVLANLPENNLQNIKVGDVAWVSFNMYPGKIFTATVTSLGRGVALGEGIPSKLLPFIDKTHDWVRLPQRFPVQLQLTPKEVQGLDFRAGASASVTILTGHSVFWNGLAYVYQWLRSVFAYLA